MDLDPAIPFNPAKYGPVVARILSCDGDGQRLMPLRAGNCSNAQARAELDRARPSELFAASPHPEGPMAGLWLYFSCWEEAHKLADACPTRDGDFWHAIVHRQEPDAWNSSYWFRRVGDHPVFASLGPEANRIAERVLSSSAVFPASRWDPYAFIEFCERAQPGSAEEQAALEIQRAEWQLLFDHCCPHANAASAHHRAQSRPA